LNGLKSDLKTQSSDIKQEMTSLRLEMKQEMTSLGLKMKQDMASMKRDILDALHRLEIRLDAHNFRQNQ